MWNKIKSWFSQFSVWNIAGAIATLLSFASIMSYFGGVTANWGIITFAIAGFWIWQKFNQQVKTATEIAGSFLWYIGTFAVILLTAYTFGASTLLGMYENWADYNMSFWGFVRVFAPILALVIGSIMIASVAAKPKNFSKKLVVLCSILSCFGLLLYEIVGPLDKWLNIKKIEQAQDFNLGRLKIDKRLGLVAEITSDNVKVYQQNEDDDSKFDKYNSGIKQGDELPLANGLDQTLNDGPHKMIEVYLPVDEDYKNKNFTSRSKTAWVRLDEVNINNKPMPGNGFMDQPLENGKVHKITFASDDWIIVWENWPRGQKILISGFDENTVYFRYGNMEAKVPSSGILNGIDQPLEMKYKKGGTLYITKK